MRILRQKRLAALVGTVAELALVAPLFVVSFTQIGNRVPLPPWVEVLKQFQKPAVPLVLRLFRTDKGVQFATRLPSQWWVYVAQGLAMLIQATIFAFVALGVMYLLWATKGRLLTLLRKRVIIIGTVWPLSDLVK